MKTLVKKINQQKLNQKNLHIHDVKVLVQKIKGIPVIRIKIEIIL